MRNRHVLAAVLLAVSVVLVACGTGDNSQTAANGPTTTTKNGGGASAATTAASGAAHAGVVHIKDDLFDPTKVEITPGDSVTWHWEGKNPHNVDGPGFKSKIQSSGTFTETFSKAGTFDYRCDVHPTMHGSVVVG